MSAGTVNSGLSVRYVAVDASSPGWTDYMRWSGLHTYGHCPAVVIFRGWLWLCTNPAVAATSMSYELAQADFGDAFVGEPEDVPADESGSAIAACAWVRDHIGSEDPVVPVERRFPLQREVTDTPAWVDVDSWKSDFSRRIDGERWLNSLADSPAWRAVYLLEHDTEERRRLTREELLPGWVRLVATSRPVQTLAAQDWVSASVSFTRQPPSESTRRLSPRSLKTFATALRAGDMWGGGITVQPQDRDLLHFAGGIEASVQYGFLHGDTPLTARVSFPTYLLSLMGMTEQDAADAIRHDVAALRPRVAVYGMWRGDRWDDAVGETPQYRTGLPPLRAIVFEASAPTESWKLALAGLGEVTEHRLDDVRYVKLTIKPQNAVTFGKQALAALQNGGVDVSYFVNATLP